MAPLPCDGSKNCLGVNLSGIIYSTNCIVRAKFSHLGEVRISDIAVMRRLFPWIMTHTETPSKFTFGRWVDMIQVIRVCTSPTERYRNAV
jgi:hypothetical protein